MSFPRGGQGEPSTGVDPLSSRGGPFGNSILFNPPPTPALFYNTIIVKEDLKTERGLSRKYFSSLFLLKSL